MYACLLLFVTLTTKNCRSFTAYPEFKISPSLLHAELRIMLKFSVAGLRCLAHIMDILDNFHWLRAPE